MDERYQNGKIYKLTCDDPTMVYYGSTIKTLSRRLTNHNARLNTTVSKKMRDIGGLQIHLVEDYPCNSRRELAQREQYYIDNNDCINEQSAFVTDEQTVEYNKAYHKWYATANKEQILEQRKQFREANRDRINQKKRERYQAIKKIK
jgi:hypothetical protein